MRSSPSTNAATASLARCSVEPNLRGGCTIVITTSRRLPRIDATVIDLSMLAQVLAECLAASVDTTTHRTEFHPQCGTDLLIGQTFDVTEHHRGTVLGSERVQSGLQVGAETRVVVDLLGVRPCGRY